MDLRLQLSRGPEGPNVEHRPPRSDLEDPQANTLGEGAGGGSVGPTRLTKTRYIRGLDNPREMWYEAHGELSPDLGARWRMEQGKLVGELAREQFPEGRFVGGSPSEEELCSGEPLFEVRVAAGDKTARADILHPAPSEASSSEPSSEKIPSGERPGAWALTEVKSSKLSGSSEKEAKRDVAFQVLVFEEAGLPVERAEILHLNPDYVRGGEEPLFARTPLGDDREKYVQEAREEAPRLAKTLRQPNPPDFWPSRNCNSCDCPEPCQELPEQSIFTLPRLYGCLDQLLEEGRITLEEIEGAGCLKEEHRRHIEAVRRGEPYVNEEAIRNALGELEYPIHFFDFETIDYAIPKFEGSGPWQKIPFQYSLHVLDEGGGTPTHLEYLHEGRGDPRPELTKHLLQHVEESGSIVVWSQWFEEKRLKELQEALPRYESGLQGVIDRLWDQAEIFRNWHYIDPRQKGSWSLKNVYPTFERDRTYAELGVQEGTEATVKYFQMISSGTSASEAEEIGQDLLAYCGLDTYAMVVIHRELRSLVENSP